MGIATYPAPSGGGIKSTQRGLAASAGNVTITAVDISKSFVTIYGTTSSGTVAASGAVNSASGTGTISSTVSGFSQFNPMRVSGATAVLWNLSGTNNMSIGARNLSGGSNNLVAAVVQGFLADSTTLTVSGACRYEVVEFN